MTSVPAGPWVLVIGCHRSGTSAVTGALAAMGLHGVDPSDRMERPDSNPEHWESLGAALFDDRLLASVGATWDAPPPSTPSPCCPPATVRTRPRVMAAAYPRPGPVVWKDPRACLLLPYWRAVLPGPLTAVFCRRARPPAVARSLQVRDGLSVAEGFALWEHYNRRRGPWPPGRGHLRARLCVGGDDPRRALGAVGAWMDDLPGSPTGPAGGTSTPACQPSSIRGCATSRRPPTGPYPTSTAR